MTAIYQHLEKVEIVLLLFEKGDKANVYLV